MLNRFALFCVFMSLSVGTFLLSQAISKSDATQTTELIAGAVLVALGLVSIALLAKDWWEWRKYVKDARRPVPE